ncbi:hypothetical protein B0H11DRAFT_2270457 [Mycena galericulata]|nr:hypothetical protein B0H11DRAFT_2270457 [Mycena galericulata]
MSRYHNQPPSNTGSSSSRNYPHSSYSSLADAGMSYTNSSNPSTGYSGGAMPLAQGQMYPPTSSSRGLPTPHPSSQNYQHDYGSQNYGMTGPPVSPDFNYPNAESMGYPDTPYTSGRSQYPTSNVHTMQWEPVAEAQQPWNDLYMPPAGTEVLAYGANNYPYTPGAYSGAPYPPTMTRTSSNNGPSPGISGVKQCQHCGTMSTPLWRRDPSTQQTLCNACGLYLQQRHAPRPPELIEADQDDDDGAGSDAGFTGGVHDGPECSHCHTHTTSVWRRSKDGDQVCNACGVYQRLRGVPRPLTLKRNKIKPRAKHSQA